MDFPRLDAVALIEDDDDFRAALVERLELENLSLEEHLEYYLNTGLPEKEAMKAVAKDRNISRRDVYNAVKR